MACTQSLAGLLNMCEGSLGGIKQVLLCTYRDGIFSDMTGTTDTGKVEIASGVTGLSWYRYYIRKNSSSFASTLTKDDANGVAYVSTELNLVFTRMDTKKRLEMTALAQNEIAALIQDANSVWWAMGRENPVTCSAGTAETGTAKGDGNKFTLTLLDEDSTFLHEFGGVVPTPANPETV